MGEADDEGVAIRHLRRADAAIAQLAAAQHGVVGRTQLLDLGLSAAAVTHRLRAGRLHRLQRGAYAVGHPLTGAKGTWMAAILSAGSGAVLSHRSAAALWGLRAGATARAEVTVAGGGRSRAGIAVHRCRLPVDERTAHDGIPVTTPARTLLDLAATLDGHRAARALERADVLRLLDLRAVEDLIGRHPRSPGAIRLRHLMMAGDISDAPTRSELEDRFLSLTAAAGLPRPRINRLLDTAAGPMEVDAVWPERCLVAELDGHAAHGTRTAFERDRARDRALAVAGWRVIRVTWHHVAHEPDRLAADLAALLGESRGASSPACRPR